MADSKSKGIVNAVVSTCVNAFKTTFTLGINHNISRSIDPPVKCRCAHCPNMVHTNFCYCSIECVGLSAQNQRHNRIDAVVDVCTNIHSKCLFVNCINRAKLEYLTMTIGVTFGQSFCESHLPKCKCGETLHTSTVITEMKYPISPEDMKKFNDVCFKCIKKCPIAGCTGMRRYHEIDNNKTLALKKHCGSLALDHPWNYSD